MIAHITVCLPCPCPCSLPIPIISVEAEEDDEASRVGAPSKMSFFRRCNERGDE